MAGLAPAFQMAKPVVKQQEAVADEDANPQPAEVVQAELAPAALKRAHFLSGIDGSIRPFLLWEWGKNPDKEIAGANTVVQSLAKKYPLDAPLAARAIILRHWQGDNALTAIDDYSNGGGVPDQLLMTLYTIYSVPKGGDLNENIKNIEAELKPGWYRDTALMDAYKAAGAEQYEIAQQKEKAAALFWQIRFFAFEILKALAVVTGLYAIFKYIIGARTDFEPMSKDFRRAYACLLIVPLLASTSVVITSTMAGMAESLNLQSLHIQASQNYLLAAACGLAGFYFLICKPAGLTFWQAMSSGGEQMSAKELSMLIIGSFCAIAALTTIGHCAAALATGNLQSLTNSGQYAILNSSGEIFSLKSLGAICGSLTLVPLIDAIFFQGLVGGYSCYRSGIVVATIFSALAFTAWHFHPSYFAEYFALGLVLSFVYQRTNNLLYTAAVHAFWNAILIVSIFFLLN